MGTSSHTWFDRSRRIIVGEVPALAFLLIGTALWASLGDDIEFYDETLYLTNGVNLLSNGRLGFGWGPGYSDLYFLLSRLVHDPINLYVVGRAMAAVLLVASVWLATRLHARATIAWTAAAVVALLPVTYVLPGVGGPAAGAGLLAVAIAFKVKGPAGIGLASAVLWLVASARPEFAFLAIGISAWAVVWLLSAVATRSRPHRHLLVTALTVCIATPALLILLHGSPVESGDRSWVAVIQHYPLHPANEGVTPDLSYQAVADRVFPGASSLSEGLSSNPSALAHHMALNVIEAPKLMLDQMLNPSVAVDPIILLTQLGLVIFMVGSALLIVAQSRSLRQRLSWVQTRQSLRNHAGAVVFTILLVLSSLVPLVVVYPRPHYQPFLIGLLVMGIAILVGRVGRARMAGWVLVLPITLIMLAFVSQVTIAYMARATQPPPTLITSLRAINESQQSWQLLTGSDGSGLMVYSPSLEMVTTPISGYANFSEYLDGAAVNAVNVTPALADGPWSSLDGFAEFVADPYAFGFVPAADRSTIWIRSRVSTG